MRRHQSTMRTGPVRALAELQRLRHTPGHTGDLCALCFEPVSVPADGYLLCGHNFHKRCLEQRGAGGAAELCPVCHESEEAGAAHADYVRQALRTIRARWPAAEVGDASKAAFYAAASPLQYDPAAELALEGGLAKNPKGPDTPEERIRKRLALRRAVHVAIAVPCLVETALYARAMPLLKAVGLGVSYYFLFTVLVDNVWRVVDTETMGWLTRRRNERFFRYWWPTLLVATLVSAFVRSVFGVPWYFAAAVTVNLLWPIVDAIALIHRL